MAKTTAATVVTLSEDERSRMRAGGYAVSIVDGERILIEFEDNGSAEDIRNAIEEANELEEELDEYFEENGFSNHYEYDWENSNTVEKVIESYKENPEALERIDRQILDVLSEHGNLEDLRGVSNNNNPDKPLDEMESPSDELIDYMKSASKYNNDKDNEEFASHMGHATFEEHNEHRNTVPEEVDADEPDDVIEARTCSKTYTSDDNEHHDIPGMLESVKEDIEEDLSETTEIKEGDIVRDKNVWKMNGEDMVKECLVVKRVLDITAGEYNLHQQRLRDFKDDSNVVLARPEGDADAVPEPYPMDVLELVEKA